MDVKTIFNGLAGISIIMLGGCSDPASSPSDVNSGVANVTLSGTAAKGIISLGNVVAEELTADGAVRVQVGNAITDGNGHYSLTINNAYLGGPIKVTVSADANTRMKCDVLGGCGTRIDGLEDIINPAAVDFGEWYKPGTLTMTALVAEATEDNATIKVNITPYTDLAANYALAVGSTASSNRTLDTGSLTSSGVYNANSEISNLLNIDILRTQPVDITDITAVSGGDPTGVAYAAISAAVLTNEGRGEDSPDINGALGTLTNSFDFNGGTLIADDTGMAMDDSAISLQEIVSGASSILNQVGGIEGIGGIGGIADISGILAMLQAQIDAIGSGDNGGNIDPTPGDTADDTALLKVKAFVGDVRTWSTAIEADAGLKGGVFEARTALASNAAEVSMDSLIGQAFFASVEVIEMHFHGRNTSPDLIDYTTGVPTSPQFTAGNIARSGTDITIADGIIDGVTVNMIMRLPVSGVISAGSSFSIEIVSASFESTATDAYINNGKATFQLTSEYVIDWTAIEQGSAAIPGILGGEIDLAMTVIQKQNKFGMPLGVDEMTFDGALSVTFVNPSAVAVAGDISGIIPIVTTMNGSVSDNAGNSFDVGFTLNITNANLLVSEGMLEYALPQIGVDFDLQLTDLPKAVVNINGTRTNVENGIATTTITYAGRRIVIKSDLGVVEEDVTALGDVTITNHDGVSMVIDGNLRALEGDVLFDGVNYATISQLDNGLAKITYSDGSFEIL